MINKNTCTLISDNSGAKLLKCIKIACFKKNPTSEGYLIRGSVQNLRSSKRSMVRVKKGEICLGVVLHTKISRFYTKVSSHSISFNINSIVLLNKQYKLIGTRIIYPFAIYFRQTKFLRLTFLGPGLIK